MAAPQHSSSKLGSAFGLHINSRLMEIYLDNFKSEITISLQHPLPSMLHDAPMFSSGIGSKPASFEDRVTVPSSKT